jgi:hypothetical protein
MGFVDKQDENNSILSSLNNSRAQHKQMDLALRLHYPPNNSDCRIKSAFVVLVYC